MNLTEQALENILNETQHSFKEQGERDFLNILFSVATNAESRESKMVDACTIVRCVIARIEFLKAEYSKMIDNDNVLRGAITGYCADIVLKETQIANLEKQLEAQPKDEFEHEVLANQAKMLEKLEEICRQV